MRELQEEQSLRRLIGTLRDAQERLAAKHRKRVPMLVKVAPDLSDDDIADLGYGPEGDAADESTA